jgi:hypothetical protein
MTRTLTLALFLFACVPAFAQNSEPNLHPQEQQPRKDAPMISFTLDFPAGTPPFYNVAIDSTGRAEYKSTPMPKSQGDPYEVKFTASEATRTRLFELARQVNFFRGDFEYRKNKVAFTGNKTLDFHDGTDVRHTTYNWSANPQIQEITTIFQNIEETMELGRQLEDKYRFDKLGVDSVLKDMEQEYNDHRLAELQAILPILTRVAKDSAMMNISRRRAEFLLSKVPGS